MTWRNLKVFIELLKALEEAFVLDAKNSDLFWEEAMAKVMEKVRVAFKILPEEDRATIGHPCEEPHGL